MVSAFGQVYAGRRVLVTGHTGFKGGWLSLWLHALGAGTIATLVFAVITRVALGHSGRPLVVRPSIAAAYVLLHLGALLRVVGPAMFPEDYERVLAAAAIAWTLSFLCFLVVYAPILVSRRPDGKPG